MDEIEHGTRETQIVRLAALGRTDKEIAERLRLSPNTVYTYWRRVRAKYGASSRGEAISKFLHESFDHFRKIVELNPDGIYITQSGRIVYASASGARMLGAPNSEELLGRNMGEFVDPSAHTIVRERTMRSERQRLPNPPRIYALRRMDGTKFQGVVTSCPIEWQGLAATLTVVRDATTDLQMAEDINYAVSDVATLPDLMYLLTKDGVYLDYRASQRFQPLVAPERMMGRHYSEIMPTAVVEALNEAFSKLSERSGDVTLRYSVEGKGSFMGRMSMLRDERVLLLIRLID